MTNRESVMLLMHFVIEINASTNVWQDVSVAVFPLARQPYLVPQQIEGKWRCNFGGQAVSNFMRKRVSDSAVVLDRFISAYPVTNRK